MFSISNTRLASILEVAEPEFQLRMLEKLPFRRVALLFQQMLNDDVVDILGNLPVGIRANLDPIWWNKVLKMISNDVKLRPDTAGGDYDHWVMITVKEHLNGRRNAI